MEYGSLSDYLENYGSTVDCTGRGTGSRGKHPQRAARRRQKSMADTMESLGKRFDDTIDSHLYRPRVDVLKTLQLTATHNAVPSSPAPRGSPPSYRHIHSRIASFRETPLTRSFDYDPKTLEQRHEMLLKPSHDMLLTIRREVKKHGETLRPAMADQFQSRLQHRLRKLTQPSDSSEVWKVSGKDLFQKPTILPSHLAVLKSKAIATKSWRAARGQKEASAGFESTCCALFHTLDLEDTGRVSSHKLVWLLLALGVCIESESISHALSTFLHSSTDRTVTQKQWILFLADRSNVPTVLLRLAGQVTDSKPGKEESDVSAFVTYVEAQFHQLSQAWEAVKLHWKAVDPTNSEFASIEKAARQLVSLGVTVQERAAVRLLARLATRAHIVSKSDFLALFVRPLLKLHIDVLDKAIRLHLGAATTVEAVSQKITEITRVTILSGMDYKPERCKYAGSVVERLEGFDINHLSQSYGEPLSRNTLRYTATPSPELANKASASGELNDGSLLEGSYYGKRHSVGNARYGSSQSYCPTPDLKPQGKQRAVSRSPDLLSASTDLQLSSDFQRFVDTPSLPGLALFLS